MLSVKTKLEANLRKVMEHGFEINKIGDTFVIKDGDLYCGIVNENKIIMTGKTHTNYTEMLKEFK